MFRTFSDLGFVLIIRNYTTRFSSRQKNTMAGTRGSLIVFEGCDRSGKTTQCNKLVNRLRGEGISCELIKFPDRTTSIGQMIDSYLRKKAEVEDHSIHLLFSANRWECVPKMKKLLQEGTTLIVDRYAFSGVAFSAAKQGLSIDWCRQPDVGLPKPDQVLYLTLSSEVAAKRGSFGTERYEITAFQERVAKNYDHLKDNTWEVIDADHTMNEVHVQIYNIVKQVIEESKTKPLASLWTKNDPNQF